jgi:Tfp pilus assembly protein FimT
MRVIACPSRDSRTCSGQTDWENGWILFADVNDERSLDAENIVPLHVETGPFPGITAYGNQPLSRSFSYMGTGLSERLSGARLMGTIFVCAPGQNSIEVVMAGSGRPKIERKQAPC